MHDTIKIREGFKEMDFPMIHDFISQSYWSKNISAETLRKALQHSLCFGAFLTKEPQNQVGFGRVITDMATFAYLADVFVLESYRKRGIATYLLKTIFSHQDLQNVRRFLLATKDAHPLYRQLGFTPLENPERMMSIHTQDLYTQQNSL